MGGGERLIKGREIEMKAERETERGGGGGWDHIPRILFSSRTYQQVLH